MQPAHVHVACPSYVHFNISTAALLLQIFVLHLYRAFPSQRATPGGVSLGTLSVQQAQHTALRLTSVRQHVLRTRYPLR